MGRMQIFFYGDKTTASASRTILPKQSYAVLRQRHAVVWRRSRSWCCESRGTKSRRFKIHINTTVDTVNKNYL